MISTHARSKSALGTGVTITLAVVLLCSPGLAALYLLNRAILPEVIVQTIALALGLVSGFAARWSMRHRSRFLRWLVALVGLSIGLLVLGGISLGKIGVDLRLARQSSNWDGLIQFTLAGATAWLAIFAWGTGDPGVAPRIPPMPIHRRILHRFGIGSRQGHPPSRGFTPTQTAEASPSQGSPQAVVVTPRPPRSVSLRQIVAPGAHRARLRTHPKARTSTLHSRIRDRRNIRVRLSSDVLEERCPYCLEMIVPNDPRGIVICETCHTAHHADCWSVTGTCQIPHHHA